MFFIRVRVLLSNLSNTNAEGHVNKKYLIGDRTVQWKLRNDQGIALHRWCIAAYASDVCIG